MTTIATIRRNALRSMVPPPRIALSQWWIEQNIRLPEGVSALPGAVLLVDSLPLMLADVRFCTDSVRFCTRRSDAIVLKLHPVIFAISRVDIPFCAISFAVSLRSGRDVRLSLI
jgi:hypothetical protein